MDDSRVGATLVVSSAAQAHSSHYEGLANLPCAGKYPTKESAQAMKDELAFQRGLQTALWALPVMNMYAMRAAQRKAFDDDSNTLMIPKDRIDYRLENTTGNPDVAYAFAWLNSKKEDPTVLDMTPKLPGKHAAYTALASSHFENGDRL